MPEGLSAVEAGKELAEHAENEEEEREHRHNKIISIFEAGLLALVAVLAAYSGWAAAKWSTESSLLLATANADRRRPTRASLDALNSVNFDMTTFNDWFTAYVAGDRSAMAIAGEAVQPQLPRCLQGLAGHQSGHKPGMQPPGPTYMPQYHQPLRPWQQSSTPKPRQITLRGSELAANSDDYVRTTVYLATVLFLAGIGSHFGDRAIRYGLAAVARGILVFAIVLLATAPKPTF